MRLRKPLADTVCSQCALKYCCNDHEFAPDLVRCPRCGHEARIQYPPAFEEQMGCVPLIIAAVVLFVLAKMTGGGGLFGVLLGLVLGVGLPFGLAVLAYHMIRASHGD